MLIGQNALTVHVNLKLTSTITRVSKFSSDWYKTIQSLTYIVSISCSKFKYLFILSIYWELFPSRNYTVQSRVPNMYQAKTFQINYTSQGSHLYCIQTSGLCSVCVCLCVCVCVPMCTHAHTHVTMWQVYKGSHINTYKHFDIFKDI